MDHDRLVLLWNRVEGLLHDVTAECIHAEVQGISSDGIGDGNDLIGRAMFEAALDEEVSESVDHERVRLSNDGFHDLILLFGCSNLQLLLEEDGRLLIVVGDDLVHDVLPIAADGAIQ